MQNKILTKKQIAILEYLGKNSSFTRQFYLTGGTPLAAFYLRHRYSEDLDFFSEQEVDPVSIRVLLRGFKAGGGITKIDFQQSMNRNLFFLEFGKDTIKTEFTYFPFPRIEKGATQYGLSVDSVTDIAANKLFTIYQRSKARDYIDLYMLCEKFKFSVAGLIKLAKLKFDWHIEPIQLATQFLKATTATEYPRMLIKLSDTKWQNFFLKEAKKIKSEIIR